MESMGNGQAVVRRDGFLGPGTKVRGLEVDWSNEDYVRVYTRETGDDLDLSWEALALWRALLLKFDKSGVIAARNGWISIARLTRIPTEVVHRAGPELLSDGRLVQVGGGFFAPNYTEAQTASKSDKVRQRESRDRRRESAALQTVDISINGHSVSRAVTPSHEQSRNVTLCSALPPSALPPVADPLLTVTPASPVTTPVTSGGRGKRLPEGWEPARTDANLEAERVASQRGVHLATELSKLRDWAQSNNAKKSDWDATWRNWTRNAKPSGSRGASQPGGMRAGDLLELQLERVREAEELERRDT